MNKELTDFFTAGKNLRGCLKKGKILVVEPDVNLRMIMNHWACKVHVPIITCSGIREAITLLYSDLRCVILNWDEDVTEPAINFLKQIDEKFPCIISVLVSKNNKVSSNIQQEIPRLTTVIKGEGLEDILFSALPELKENQHVSNY